MAATAGGYNIDNYLIPIDSTLRIYNVPGSNMNVLGVAPDAIGKIEVDGVTLTTNAQGAITLNLANSNTWTATQTFIVNGTAAIFQNTSPKNGTIVEFYSNSGTVTGYINGAGDISFNVAWFNGSVNTNSSLNINATTTTLAGTTAGSIVYSMPFQGSSYKKVVVYLNGYENDTTTAQTITFPTAFTYTPNVYNPAAVPGVTVSTTALSIDPNTTTVYTAWIIVEGF